MRSVLALRQLQESIVRVSHNRVSAPTVNVSCTPLAAPRLACTNGVPTSGISWALAPMQQQQQQRRAVATHALALAPTSILASEARSSNSSTGCFSGCGVLGWATNFNQRFTVGPEVGRGSFGVVHVATSLDTGREYAVKVLPKHPGGSPTSTCCTPVSSTNGSSGASPQGMTAGAASEMCLVDDEHLEAIEREVSAWVSVQGSQFVARLEGLYEDEDNAYLVQELCDGTIKGLLEARGVLGEAEAATLMRGVLDVLFECHQRDMCYGDVKPANFLVTSEGPGSPASVRAVDFGCSRPVPLTQPCGSPLYMAPEMANRRFGTAIDMWAAGVMLFQLLTGRLPFWGKNMTLEKIRQLPPYAIVAAVRTHDVSYERSEWRRLSPEAQQLVQAMLERNPAARITAAEALAHPWFQRVLGFTPRPSGKARLGQGQWERPEVEFSSRVAAMHL